MKILWVAKNSKAAEKRMKMLDPERKLIMEDNTHMIITPGAPICGRIFDEVIFDGFNPYAVTKSLTETETMVAWLDDAVRTRLAPEGKIRILTEGL